MYGYSVIGHKEGEALPVACTDKEAMVGMVRHLLADGYEVITVRERLGQTNQFRLIHHIDIRWMSDL